VKEGEGDECLRSPIQLRGLSALAWEAFSGPCRDQWRDNGSYDYTLAAKFLECFGLEPWQIFEALRRLSVIVQEVRAWADEKKEQEEATREFEKQATEALGKL
jgi:hypothetical protein